MATIDNLNYTSISEMPNDEAINLLCQIRLNRRHPVKQTKQGKRKATKKQTPELSQQQAAELLKMLGGE